ncbi:MAG TPA: SRPBCC family protein [Ktedonobacterales bacterium]
MVQHQASVRVNRPVEQVYPMFTHFNDFPKFMHFIKEVTYYDDANSHWVADVAGRHEWDAVNSGWQTNRQVGWESTNGLENRGVVTFQAVGPNLTEVTVLVEYTPPAGVLGSMGEALGAGKRFEQALQQDLNHFARMVEEAPPGTLDPEASTYLFHADSAAARGETTEAQNQSMDIP